MSKAMGRLKAIMRVRKAGASPGSGEGTPAESPAGSPECRRSCGAAGGEMRAQQLASSGELIYDPQICDPLSSSGCAMVSPNPGRCEPEPEPRRTLTLTLILTLTLTLTLADALLSRPMGSAPRGRLATPLEPLNLGLPRAAPATTPLEGRRRHG